MRKNSDINDELLDAAAKGHTEIVQKLLDKNADPNLASDNGITPLYRAKAKGHTEIVELLEEYGARE